jgi:hypothetical protein
MAEQMSQISGLDPGIQRFVDILREHGVETCQSCQGGEGHCYDWPTIDFVGGDGAGWHALGVCLDFGLPVMSLRREWSVSPSGVSETVWQLVFRHDAIWWAEHCKSSDADVRQYMRTGDPNAK